MMLRGQDKLNLSVEANYSARFIVRDNIPPQPISASSPQKHTLAQMGRKVCTHPHWLCFPKDPAKCLLSTPRAAVHAGPGKLSPASCFAGTANSASNSKVGEAEAKVFPGSIIQLTKSQAKWPRRFIWFSKSSAKTLSAVTLGRWGKPSGKK